MDKLLVLLVLIGIVILVLSAFGGNSQPMPTATPMPQSAEIILARAISEIAVESSAADKNTAHPSPTPISPSETERIVRAAAFPLFGSIACLGCVFTVAVLALVWHSAQKGRNNLALVQELRASMAVIQTNLERLRSDSGQVESS